MAKDKAFFKVFRSVTESGRWNNKNKPFDERSALIDLFALANYAETTFCPQGMKSFTIPVGVVFRPLSQLSEKWGWSKKKVQRFLTALEGEGVVRIEGTPFGTLIYMLDLTSSVDSDHTGVHTGVHTPVHEGVPTGVQSGVQMGVQHKKNREKNKNIKKNKNQEPASGGDNIWGGRPE